MISNRCSGVCRVLIVATAIGAGECRAGDETNNRRQSVQIDAGREDPLCFLRGLGFAADNRTLCGAVFTSANRDQLVLWDVTTGKRVREFGIDGPVLDSMRLTSKGASAVTLTQEIDQPSNTFRVWDLESGQLRATIGSAAPDVFDFEVTPDGQTIVTAVPNGLIRVFDVPTGIETSSSVLEQGVRGSARLAMSPDGKVIAAAVRQRLYLWERLGNQKPVGMDTGRDIRALAFSPDGTVLADGATRTGGIVLRDVRTQRIQRTLTDLPQAPTGVSGLVFSPDGQTIAAADGAGVPPISRRVLVWRVQDGKVLHRFEMENQNRPQNARMAISGDSRWLAVGWDGYGVIDVWDVSRDGQGDK